MEATVSARLARAAQMQRFC